MFNQKKKKLNELSKKVKAILTNGLTKDWIFLMEQNIFLQGYFKIIQCLYQLKNILNTLAALLGLNRGNLNQTAILHQLLLIIIYYTK